MKQPRIVIRSTRQAITPTHSAAPLLPTDAPNLEILSTDNSSAESLRPSNANLIESDDDSTDANFFCFAAFADKRTGVLYNNLMGPFSFMSLKGNVCFLIVYHYKTNVILALPIKGFSKDIIFAAYKQQFNLLESKGYKIWLNVMDNQATQVIKRFFDTHDCDLLLVEPHNHRVNAAEQAIQMFKVHFLSALAMTDSDFPLQLWDRLTPQVESILNMMRPSRTNPNISTHKAIHGPYNWSHFPLAPWGCKAVIYESPEARNLWGGRGTNAWYAGPLFDHYGCNHYFVPKTQAYRISGSAELFPQHCQVPFFMWNEHLQEVPEELVMTLHKLPVEKCVKVLSDIKNKLSIGTPSKDKQPLTSLNHEWLLPPGDLQRVPAVIQPEQRMEQRVDTTHPPFVPALQRFTDCTSHP